MRFARRQQRVESGKNDEAYFDRMVSLLDQMPSFQETAPHACTPHEQTALEQQIEATDRQIDALVYEPMSMDG